MNSKSTLLRIFVILFILLLARSNAGLISYPNALSPCILLDLSGTLTLTLKPSNGSSESKISGLDGATPTPYNHCADSQNIAEIDLLLNGISGTLSLVFYKGTDSKVHMNVKFTFIPSAVFKNNDSIPVTMEEDGDTVLSNDTASYTCSEIKQLPFKHMGQYELMLSFGKVQIQAFNVHKVFFAAEDCSGLHVVSTEGATTNPTTQASTTSEPSTPAPGSATVHTYTGKYSNGSTCVILKAGIEFKIPYYNTRGEQTSKFIGIPMTTTSVTGNCAGPNGTQNLEISFYNGWKVMMVFREDANNMYLSNVELTVNVNKELIPDAEPYFLIISQSFDSSMYSASKSGSYKCNDGSKVGLTNGFEMDTYNLQFSAFQRNITAFPTAGITGCAGDRYSNYVVPIAVGAGLAGLVVIVLIAYLIDRKKSIQTGYEQANINNRLSGVQSSSLRKTL